jgi:predicted cupin superfamily sugar epimerase
MSQLTAQNLIETYHLQPHPEGGFFTETYRSSGIIPKGILPQPYQGARHYATAIYFLLPQEAKSNLHRLQSDETWHFYLGSTLKIIQLSPDGKLETIQLGSRIANGDIFQHTVPGGYWFGAYPDPTMASEQAFSFVGCTVSPGFDFSDFMLADRKELLTQFPHASKEIEYLTTESFHQ